MTAREAIAACESDGCWNWPRSLKDGYGRVRINGKQEYVHRVSYALFRGEIPDGLVVRHDCDNRRCVNPEHLRIGKISDNIKDRDKRGRTARGAAHGRAKLMPEQVKAIFLSREPASVLAKAYGVHPRAIDKIRHEEAWLTVTAALDRTWAPE